MASFNVNIETINCGDCFKEIFSCFKNKKTKKNTHLSISSIPTDKTYPLVLEDCSYFIIDKDLKYIASSGMKEIDIRSKDMVGKTMDEILPRDICSFFSEIYKETMESKMEIKKHIKLNEKFYELIGSPILSNKNTVYGCFIIHIPYSDIEIYKKKELSNNDIVFHVDKDYIIKDVSVKTWDKFISNNKDTEKNKSYNIINTNLLASISCDKVRNIHKKLIDLVFQDVKPIKFNWFCDSSTVERKLQMTISKVNDDLVQLKSVMLYEIINFTNVEYLDYPSINNEADLKMNENLFLVCTFCKRIRILLSDKKVLHKEPSRYPTEGVPETIGEKGKEGYTLEFTKDTEQMLAWVLTQHWSIVKNKNKDKYIKHDLCLLCESEMNNFIEHIEKTK